MPFYKITSIHKNLYLSIWEIKESEEELLAGLTLSESDQLLLQEIQHSYKRLEFLCGRRLVKTTLDRLQIEDHGMYRNEYGKPELINSPYQLSLSHTENYVVMLLGKEMRVGIDIEKPQEKMRKIAPRLFNTEELEYADDDLYKLSQVWSAKEVLFKLHEIGEIDFKQHLKLDFKEGDAGQCLGMVQKEGETKRFTLTFEDFKGYIICYNV